MAVNLSPIGNGFQFFDNNGAPLNALQVHPKGLGRRNDPDLRQPLRDYWGYPTPGNPNPCWRYFLMVGVDWIYSCGLRPV